MILNFETKEIREDSTFTSLDGQPLFFEMCNNQVVCMISTASNCLYYNRMTKQFKDIDEEL